MRPFPLSPILAIAIVGAAAGAVLTTYMQSPEVSVHAQGKSQFAPGHQTVQGERRRRRHVVRHRATVSRHGR
jgi:hypothetical protein